MSRLPDTKTLQYLAKLSIDNDKPVLFDYWVDSLDKKIVVAVKDPDPNDKDAQPTKYIVKSKNEYTSTVVKNYKVERDFIFITENSIYVIDAETPFRKAI